MVAVYATVSYVLWCRCIRSTTHRIPLLAVLWQATLKNGWSITSIRFIGSTIAQFVVARDWHCLSCLKFGHGDNRSGWFFTILFSIIAFVCFIITFFSFRANVLQPPPQQKMNIKEDIKETFSDVPLALCLYFTLFIFITLAMWGSAMSFLFPKLCRPTYPVQILEFARTGFHFYWNNWYRTGILGAFNLICPSRKRCLFHRILLI